MKRRKRMPGLERDLRDFIGTQTQRFERLFTELVGVMRRLENCRDMLRKAHKRLAALDDDDTVDLQPDDGRM